MSSKAIFLLWQVWKLFFALRGGGEKRLPVLNMEAVEGRFSIAFSLPGREKSAPWSKHPLSPFFESFEIFA